MRAVKVTARLASEISGSPPQLDGLLIDVRCRYYPPSGPHERYDPAPAMDAMPPCPIHRQMFGGWFVHHCSAPIVDVPQSDRHERFSQHFPREYACLLRSRDQGTIATTNGAHKSMWLPVRRRLISAVAWFVVVHDSPKELRRELRRSVTHIGQDRARGHGRVAEWVVEEADDDYSWFAPHPDGKVLMRSLPLGDWLPKDMVGYVRDFDAVTPPYYHPGRKTEIVRPC